MTYADPVEPLFGPSDGPSRSDDESATKKRGRSSTTYVAGVSRTPDDVFGSDFANLVIDGEFQGQFVDTHRKVAPNGLPWHKRDRVQVGASVDVATKALLKMLAEMLGVSQGSVIEALVAWFGTFACDETGDFQRLLAEPRARQMLLGALEGHIPFPHFTEDGDVDSVMVEREELLDSWLSMLTYMFSRDFYEENACYRMTLTHQHNQWLKRLAKKKGTKPVQLLADVIEALAVRDLGVTPSTED